MAIQDKTPRFITIFQEKEFWILLLVGILYFYRPLFMGDTFYYRDLCLNIYPSRQTLIELVKTGQVLWNPYLHGGRPFLGSVTNFTLYPFNLLYAILPALTAFNLTIVLHVILCSVHVYLLSRILGLKPLSSLVAGVVYAYSGYTLSAVNLFGIFLGLPYLPLLLMFWHLFLLEQRKRWFIMTVLSGVMQVFAGAMEIHILSVLFLLGWSLIYPYPQQSFLRKIGGWFMLEIGVAGLAAIQIIPTIEVILHSARGSGVDYLSFTRFSLHPLRLPEFILPGFMGHLDLYPSELYYWGMSLTNNRIPFLTSIYVGLPVLMCALFGVIRHTNRAPLRFHIRIYLFSLVCFSFLISLGRYLPLFEMLYTHLPLITLVRSPIKFLAAASLPLALLTGYSSEILFGARTSCPPPLSGQDARAPMLHSTTLALGGGWGLAFLLLISAIAMYTSSEFARAFHEFFFMHSESAVSRQGLIMSFAHAVAIWTALMLLFHARMSGKRPWQHWVFAFLLVVDLLAAGRRVNFYAPEEFFTLDPPVVPVVREHIGEGRIFRNETEPSYFILKKPSQDMLWYYRWNLEVLYLYLSQLYKFPTIFHQDFDKMAAAYISKLAAVVHHVPWEQRLPLLSAAGVTVVLSAEDISAPGITPITKIPNRSNIPYTLYHNESAAKRVEFVTHWKQAKTDADALGMMISPNYDPRKYAVLQQPESQSLLHYFITSPLKKGVIRYTCFTLETHIPSNL